MAIYRISIWVKNKKPDTFTPKDTITPNNKSIEIYGSVKYRDKNKDKPPERPW